MCESIDYYNSNAEHYIAETEKADLSRLYALFEKYLRPGSVILDIGCGSGRDSKYFCDKKYKVYAHDGSEAMVDHAKKYLGDRVAQCYFEDFEPEKLFHQALLFDGMWACASLLHVKEEKLVAVIDHYTKFLKAQGVFFMSFKERDENHQIEGRYFTNFTPSKLKKMITSCKDLELLEILETRDVRDERENEAWLSVIVRKSLSDSAQERMK